MARRSERTTVLTKPLVIVEFGQPPHSEGSAGYYNAMPSPACVSSSPVSTSLAAYLKFLLPHTESELLSRETVEAIFALAQTLPPVPRIALEFRLNADETQVDVQQQFLRDQDAFPYLIQYLRSPSLAVRDSFKRFADWLHDAEDLSSVHVNEVFLEFDLPSASEPSLPSIFISLPEDRCLALEVAFRAIELLASSGKAVLQAAVARCITACAGEEMVSGLGFMLGRANVPIRINVKRLLPSTAKTYLEAIGHSGDSRAAAERFTATLQRADRVTLALDLLLRDGAARIMSRVGMECYFDAQPADDLLWTITLGELCDEGLCSPAKAQALMALPERTQPNDSPWPWPLDLIALSATQPRHYFSTFIRKLYHLKFSGEPSGQWEAKAYMGASHEWTVLTDLNHHVAPTKLPRRVNGPIGDADDPLSLALEDGVRFLLRRQMQSGLWRDFKTPSISDEWVSAFIGCQLLDTGLEAAHEASEECATTLLQTQRSNGGWGYWIHQAPDADSTAWVLRLLNRLGRENHEGFRRGLSFLECHVSKDGGVCTYDDSPEVAAKLGVKLGQSFAGWQQAHVCVTGAAAQFLGNRSREYLNVRQQEGHWSGYWWHGDAYSTGMAVSALASVGGFTAAVHAAQQWAADRVSESLLSPNRNPFDIAWYLKILCEVDSHRCLPQIDEATQMLLSLKAENGWLPSARMRIPLPSTLICTGEERVHLDYRGCFTTAAVVSALATSQQVLQSSGIGL